jgi:hypothetical protein
MEKSNVGGTMDAIERKICSLMVVNRNIPLTFFLDHLSWRTKS